VINRSIVDYNGRYIIYICSMLALTVSANTPGSHYYFGIKIQGLFKDFQGPWSCIFKDQFSTEFTAWTLLKQHVISTSVITGQF